MRDNMGKVIPFKSKNETGNETENIKKQISELLNDLSKFHIKENKNEY